MYRVKFNWTEENESTDCIELARFPQYPTYGYPSYDDGNGMYISQESK